MEVSILKVSVMSAVGVVGGLISNAFGGWSSAMTTLIIFIVLDYITGLIVAGVFKKSGKSANGALESRAGFKGLCRKGMILLIVLVGCRLDIMLGTSYIKDAVCISFVANETLSIIENAGLMGVPIPNVITKAIDVLKNKGDSDEE